MKFISSGVINLKTPLKVNGRFGGACRLSPTLKMEVKCFSESSVDLQRTTQGYIPQDRNFHFYFV